MNERILIIEDDKNVLENIKILLIEEGYSVFTEDNGNEGIKFAQKELPDLIICDIMMPGIDGYSVIKKLRENKATVSIPFIFLTAKAEKDNLRLGMQLGADDYIFKPFLADDLLKSVRLRIEKRKDIKEDSTSPLLNPYSNKNNIQGIQKYSLDDKIFIQEKGQPNIIKVREISFIEAKNQYTSVHLVKGKFYLVRKSISAWVAILPPKFFMRIHRSTIINIEQIEKMEKWHNSSLVVYLNNIKKPFMVSKKNSAKLRKNIF